MKNRFHVVDVTEEPNLTLTRQQQDMRNRGFVFAVIDGSAGTVVSLYKTQARAETVADLHNERQITTCSKEAPTLSDGDR